MGDGPEILRALAGSPVHAIEFLDSGKYDTARVCTELGIPFAAAVGELR
ncbi:hypothetical protein Adeg_1347 [Ammonifex degensii KC4]|uniref:Uncharacterized protein n=1 Tax=Ammonifex degensii (strain DSM 10501 / KC4) TaxID=429009 RepID=C9R823_AMMDK|nr:hypothetical protein [Ammonifex degensii]ACX52452.1 hypothetical protein Adeg_1347 [Ammonifex degensii KC4]